MKTSYKRLIRFRNTAAEYLQKFETETKLHYALKKVLNRTEEAIKEFQEKTADIKLEYALVDKDGAVLFTETPSGRVYKMDKEGLRKSDKEINALFEEETVSIEPFFCTELPKDLHESWLPAFEDFVIDKKGK